MHRRQFLATSFAASALAFNRTGSAEASAGDTRDYYQIRRYNLRSGPQLKLMTSYLGDALIPALARMNMGPIGAFRLEIGPEAPACYLVIPSKSIDALVKVDLKLSEDADFLRTAAPFWKAPAAAPAFQSVEYSLLAAFEGWPRLTKPPYSTTRSQRIFQLRTYVSPSYQDHVRKVKMFHSGEFEIFLSAGFHPLLFGDTLIGSHMPSLTYMLSFKDLADLDAKWDKFRNSAGWKKLSTDPRFSYEAIVSNITNLVLSPLSVSQI